MAYTLDFISFFNLVIDYEAVDLTTLTILWCDYSGLAAIMSLALMSTVSLDQFSLLMGRLHPTHKGFSNGVGLEKQPLIQFLKYQFLGGTRKESSFLIGAEKIGPFRFFVFNLCSTAIWLAVVFTAGILLRLAINHFIGRFGPVGFEVIVGILIVYIVGLTGTVILKKLVRTI